MWLIGLLLIAVFFGLGFVAKVLWWGLIIGVVLVIAGMVSGSSRL